KTLSLVATVATVAVMASWIGAEAPHRASRIWGITLAITAYVTMPRTAVHAVSGMETALFALMLSGLFTAGARAVRNAASSPSLPLLALVATLTRPEGALAGVVVLATVGVFLPHERRAELARASLTYFAAPLAADEAFRLWYYGAPLPLPFYVKLD